MTHKEVLLSLVGIGQNRGGGGDVPAVIEPLSVSANGTYTAPTGPDGYSPVTVDVPGPSGTKTITANGMHSVAGFATAEVNVPASGDKSVGLIDGTATVYESDEVLTVRNLAFNAHTALQRVSLPNATSIGNSAFNQCSALTDLNLPAMTTAGAYAFRDTRLQDVEFPALRTTGLSCFLNTYFITGGPFLETVRLPSYYGTNATSSSTPQTFASQTKLKTVDIGTGGVTATLTVSNQDFYGCSALDTLIIRYNRVATLRGTNALTGTKIAGGTGFIYTPRDYLAAYQSATNWATYSAQFRALEDYTIDGTTTGELDPNKI